MLAKCDSVYDKTMQFYMLKGLEYGNKNEQKKNSAHVPKNPKPKRKIIKRNNHKPHGTQHTTPIYQLRAVAFRSVTENSDSGMCARARARKEVQIRYCISSCPKFTGFCMCFDI